MIAKQYCNSTRRQGISVKDASLGVILTWVGTQGLAVTDCDLGTQGLAVTDCDPGTQGLAVTDCDPGTQGLAVTDCDLGTQGLAVTDCDLGPVKELLSQRAPVSSFILQECLNLSRPLRSFKNRIKFLKSI